MAQFESGHLQSTTREIVHASHETYEKGDLNKKTKRTMASATANEIEAGIDSNETRETAEIEKNSPSHEEQNVDASDLDDKRKRTRSEKGLQMDLDSARRKRDRAGKALGDQIKFVDELMRQSKDIIALSAGLEGLQMKMESLKSLHETTVNVTQDLHEDDTGDFDYFSSMSDLFVECVADVKSRIKMLEDERTETLTQRSHASTRSKNTQRTSSSMRAAAEAAALQAKMNSLKKQQELERKQELMKREQRELERLEEQERLQGELDAAVARRSVLDLLEEKSLPKENEHPQDDISEIKNEPINEETKRNEAQKANTTLPDPLNSQSRVPTPLNVHAFTPLSNELRPSTLGKDQIQLLQRENTEIQRQQVELLKRMTLPIPKPPVFTGDILEYPKWSSAFDALIEEDAIKPNRKLCYLGEYTSGKAQTMITGLLGLQTDDAYKKARNVLKERFGNPFNIYEAYREKLRAWPVCSTANELQEFSDFLLMTQETMKAVKYLKEFDNFAAIRELAARLPPYYTNKWREHAKKTDKKNGEYTFSDFVDFTQEAASDATHPVFSHEALAVTRRQIQKGASMNDKWHSSDKKSDKKAGRGTTFTAKTGDERNPERRPSPNKSKCFLCSKPHELENCPEFLKMSVEERTAFARTKGLCFACLTKGHMTRQCEQKKQCTICKKPHVTALHFKDRPSLRNDQPPEGSNDETTKTTLASSCASICHANNHSVTTSALIVPVWLHHKDDPSREVQVYAVLDDQSDTCFVTNEVCEELGLEGPTLTLELGTMHAVENISTSKTDGLVVSRHDKLVKIELPKSYTREQIPARKEQIPRPETTEAWKHLRPIASKIPPY